MNNLAIIIPAYKAAFLDKALASIAGQTCKDFTLYIGDDASPHDLYSIVKKYENKINIQYHRFEENAGGKDLVAQWERCIALSQSEEWLWLFSDDDEMESECVEAFYKEISNGACYDLYHFNVTVIDENSRVLQMAPEFPAVLPAESFLLKKLSGKISSFVCEYIFNKEAYCNAGKFQNFDMAWNSDDATWVKLGVRKGIKTIDKAKVNWRRSQVNITSNTSDRAIVKRKLQSNIEYSKWICTLFGKKHILQLMRWQITGIIVYKNVLLPKEQKWHIKDFCKQLNKPYLHVLGIVYYYYKKRRLYP
ncbi:MAG: glycosyltransferase [Bacteroidetes bacterium]|nr:glycosyltransferase [Bacteroidota bacterium]